MYIYIGMEVSSSSWGGSPMTMDGFHVREHKPSFDTDDWGCRP